MNDIVCFDSLGNRVTEMYQWDKNQILVVRGVPVSPSIVFQFANCMCGTSEDVEPTISGDDLIVEIPSELLEEARPIFAYIYKKQSSGAGRTIGSIFIPVRPRVRPDDLIYIDDINNE